MTVGPELSVIICTHNPDAARLSKVLQHLRAQTLRPQDWWLLLIDNRSEPGKLDSADISWHPNAKIIREERLGLTWARLRGIREAAGALLVFVDDDNLLGPDYLEQALVVAQEWPMIGAWGGEVTLDFESPPPEWTRPYWWMLGSRAFERDAWSNQDDGRCLPCGAGMCLRPAVAAEYASRVLSDPRRQALDRRGANLSSSGDTDMALTSFDLQMGIGQSTRLKLRHLIPAKRLTEDYLVKLHEGMAFSDEILQSLRHAPARQASPSLLHQARNAARYLRLSALDKKMHRAALAGREKARQLLPS